MAMNTTMVINRDKDESMSNMNLFYLLQLAGGTFPTGGFSQSWGLENYVSRGVVKDEQTFTDFLKTYLDTQIASCECPLSVAAMRCGKKNEWKNLAEIEQLSVASKLTRESREGAVRMGKALMRIACNILDDKEMNDFYMNFKKGLTYSTAYGLVSARLNMMEEEALGAYVFSSVNGLVQSGIKLVPLGNTVAQKILLEAAPLMKDAVDKGLSLDVTEISYFSPGLDLGGIWHETQTVRLYMS